MFLFSSQQIIHQTNQQKIENELQILNSMINKVREVRDPVVFFLTPCVPFVSWITQMYLSSCFYLFIYFIPADAPVFARRCAEMRPAPTAGWIHRMICLWLLSSWFIYIVLFMFYADWIKWFWLKCLFFFCILLCRMLLHLLVWPNWVAPNLYEPLHIPDATGFYGAVFLNGGQNPRMH